MSSCSGAPITTKALRSHHQLAPRCCPRVTDACECFVGNPCFRDAATASIARAWKGSVLATSWRTSWNARMPPLKKHEESDKPRSNGLSVWQSDDQLPACSLMFRNSFEVRERHIKRDSAIRILARRHNVCVIYVRFRITLCDELARGS